MPRPKPAAPPFDPARRPAALVAQGRAVAAARKARGLTQAGLAEWFGVSLGAVKRWEDGSRGSPATARATLASWTDDPEVKAALAVDTGRCPCCGRPYSSRS